MTTNNVIFNENLTTLDVPTLERSVSYELARGGLRKTAPLEHYELINNIADLIGSNTTYKPVCDPIYATERNTLRVMWKGKKEECPVENYLFQRIFTKINIVEENQKKLNIAIAISYHEKGIDVAYGVNVHVCKNLLIFGSNSISTYGGNSVKYDHLMDILDDWLKRYDEKKKKSEVIINTLQNHKVKENELFSMLGKLIYHAERSNNMGSNGSSLNVSQTLRLIDNYNLETSKEDKKKSITAFDVLQWGTNNLKPDKDSRDLTQIISTSNKFSNFVISELCPEISLN